MSYENILYRIDQGIDNYGTGVAAPVDTSYLYETEEERRKRLEKERQQTVQTQTVETAADGTQTVTTKQVAQPTVAAPISPETYQRMIQAESGGQNFTPQGQPLTSPKGAMFAAQVMPATAAQPGFGVRPAQAQTPEEYNRVGQEYYQALLKKYNGNEQLAAAAYNMGPGAVDKNIQRNQGQFNVAQAPRETQGYLNKVFQGVGRAVEGMIPSAQAGTLPQPQAGAGRGTMGMPQAVPEEGVAVATGRGVQGTMTLPEPQTQPQTQPAIATSSQPYIDMYQRDQNDPLQMLALRGDTSAPEFIRRRAGERARELMDQEYQRSRAEQQAQQLMSAAAQGDRKASNTIARELQSQEGSWLKFLFLGFVNKELAGMELVKLGFGNVDRPVQDSNGKSYMVTYNALGTPLKGFSADGKDLTQEELIKVAAGVSNKQDYDIVGGTFVSDTAKDAQGNPLVGSLYRSKTNPNDQFIMTSEGKKSLSGFRPQTSQGSLADQRARLIQELNLKLQGKTQEEKMAITRDYNSKLVGQGHQPVQPYEVNLQAPQIAAPAAQPAAGAVPPAAAQPAAQGGEVRQLPQTVAPPAQTQPAAAPAAAPAQPAPGTRPTASQLAAQAAGATTAAKVTMDAAAAEVAKSPDTANMIRSINKSINIIDSGKHNIGSVLSGVAGRGPIAQAIGSQFETVDSRNTKTVMDLVNKLAADGLKALGSNPSTVDLEFWTKFKPDASSDPQFVRDWIQSRSEDLQRRVNYNRQQLGLDPVFANDQDRQAYEWTKKNANDPRAQQIRQKLGLQ